MWTEERFLIDEQISQQACRALRIPQQSQAGRFLTAAMPDAVDTGPVPDRQVPMERTERWCGLTVVPALEEHLREVFA